MSVHPTPYILGIDVGGANLKVASNHGDALSCFFPLWKEPDQLAGRLREFTPRFRPPDVIAVTMTGEMADCFFTREEGVQHIVRHCLEALGTGCLFYAVTGTFLAPHEAVKNPSIVASSNWHALATLAAQWCQDEGLLIDIGSTTTDLIRLASGQVQTTSRTDFDRLRSGELIYCGVGRTPVCAVTECLPFRGALVPVMNEVFATTDDCALLAGMVPPDPDDCATCDALPRTLEAARNRLARMIGLDLHQISPGEAMEISFYVLRRIQARLSVTAEILSSPAATWILAGHGSWLVDIPQDRLCLDLESILSPTLSRVGPAYAVARLAERFLAETPPPHPSAPTVG